MDRLVDVLFHRGRLIIAVWVLLTALGAVFAVGLEGRAVPGGEASSSSQAESVARELSRNGQPSLFVVVTGEAAKSGTDGAHALQALRTKLADTPGVREVVALPLPPPARDAGPVTVLGLSTAGGVDASIDVARRILDLEGLAPPGSEAFLGGYGAHREELVELSRSDLLRAEKVGVPIVIVVLLLTFGSIAATFVPLAIGLAALAGGLGAAGALAFGIPFSEYVTNAAAMVGLALAVDYAMFLVQRVREALLQGTDVDEAVRDAMRTTGVAIAWSGLTVLLAEATMLLVDARSIRTAALGMMLVTVCALAAALIAAPLILRSLGYRLLRQAERAMVRNTTGLPVGPAHRADRLATALSAFRRSRISRSHRREGESSGFWGRWGEQMTSRPRTWLIVGAGLLAVLCIPAFGIAQRVDLPSAAAMPADSQVRQASEIGAKAYGPGVLSPVEIVVHSTPDTVERQARRVADVLRNDPEVRSVNLLPLQAQDAYRVSVATTHGPAHDRTEALVTSLRDGKLHASLSGVRYEVGGESAMRLDAKVALFESLPLMIGVLLVLVLVLFMMAMRSIVLPLKGIVLVVISLGATRGRSPAAVDNRARGTADRLVAATGPAPDRAGHDRGARGGAVHRLRGHPDLTHRRAVPGDRGQHPRDRARCRAHRPGDQQRRGHHDRRLLRLRAVGRDAAQAARRRAGVRRTDRCHLDPRRAGARLHAAHGPVELVVPFRPAATSPARSCPRAPATRGHGPERRRRRSR